MSQMPLKNLNKKHTVLSNIYLSLFALSIIWILTLIIYTTLRHRIPDYQASNVFIYALPISAITLFTLMTIRKLMIASLITLSVTSWTLLLSLTIVTRHFEGNYLLFIIGIPVQILIIVIYAYAILKKKEVKKMYIANDLIYTKINRIKDFKATVILTHGICEHTHRYDEIVETLNQEGYQTVQYDLRGHGRSGGKRGDIESFHRFVDDLHEIVGKVKSEFVDKPVILFWTQYGWTHYSFICS